LKVLDDRLVFLENELDVTGRQISNTPMSVRAQTQVPAKIVDTLDNNIVPITAIVSISVLAPLALAFARLLWKRANRQPAISDDANRKLEQLMQAVDTIAIEVERISESQRYLTKVVNERQPDQIPRSASRSN
jgi:prefoldin subunit 5